MLPDNPKDFWTSSPVIKIKIYKKVTASFPAIVWGKAKPNQKPNLKQNLKKTKTKRQQKTPQKTKNPLKPNMQDIGLDQFPLCRWAPADRESVIQSWTTCDLFWSINKMSTRTKEY